MEKWKQFKEKIRNPHPERLAQVEYRSHFMHMLAVFVVSIILISQGFWYIVFAFVFMLGVSYSQGMSALAKYKMIKQMNPIELPPIKKDPSFTRRRSRIIQNTFGKKANWLTTFLTIVLFLVFYFSGNFSGAFLGIPMTFGLVVLAFLVYYFPIYWTAIPFYKSKKEVKN